MCVSVVSQVFFRCGTVSGVCCCVCVRALCVRALCVYVCVCHNFRTSHRAIQKYAAYRQLKRAPAAICIEPVALADREAFARLLAGDQLGLRVMRTFAPP